jgi:hypothetical protein
MIALSPLASFCHWRRAHAGDGRVEIADRALAAREGGTLVAIEPRQPHERAVVARVGLERGEERALGTAHPVEIDHRLGDPAGERVAGRIGLAADVGPLDAAGEVDDLARGRRLGQHRQGEAVPARISRRGRLAGGRARAGAARCIAAVGADLCGAGHVGPPRRVRTTATRSSRGAVSPACSCGVVNACLIR